MAIGAHRVDITIRYSEGTYPGIARDCVTYYAEALNPENEDALISLEFLEGWVIVNVVNGSIKKAYVYPAHTIDGITIYGKVALPE